MSALLNICILCGGFGLNLGFMLMTASWSQIPEITLWLLTNVAFEVISRSNVLPDAGLVSSFTNYTKESSKRLDNSLACSPDVLGFVVLQVSQFMLGRLKSPPMMIMGFLLNHINVPV